MIDKWWLPKDFLMNIIWGQCWIAEAKLGKQMAEREVPRLSMVVVVAAAVIVAVDVAIGLAIAGVKDEEGGLSLSC